MPVPILVNQSVEPARSIRVRTGFKDVGFDDGSFQRVDKCLVGDKGLDYSLMYRYLSQGRDRTPILLVRHLYALWHVFNRLVVLEVVLPILDEDSRTEQGVAHIGLRLVMRNRNRRHRRRLHILRIGYCYCFRLYHCIQFLIFVSSYLNSTLSSTPSAYSVPTFSVSVLLATT
ncbi:hypothetical protein IX323_003162 [Bacteroides pyogenes]|nr:hypothetical protein [Bacteroides pyogenes]